jgi:hypothetical protein
MSRIDRPTPPWTQRHAALGHGRASRSMLRIGSTRSIPGPIREEDSMPLVKKSARLAAGLALPYAKHDAVADPEEDD